MTVIATSESLNEAGARALAAAIDGDELLWAHSFDLSETAPGVWRVTVFFEDEPDRGERAALARLADGGSFEFATLPEANWVAKSLEGLAPVRAGPFLVHGAHDRGAVQAHDIGIEIEAGMAFGTGHHGTTSGCLIAIDRIARRTKIRRALDVGTGSGVLAIAIAKRTRAHVVASDIDPVAVKVARENVRLNGVASRVNTVVATGLNHPAIEASAPYDLIMANILAGPLVALAAAIKRATARGGTVVLSGLTLDQERRVAAAYRSVGLTRVSAIRLGEWVTLILRR
ncbi:MAG TPA: 50S ribosomal protein L11 methyltransferase [Bauldia sp.]|nr:50S ribosomal protein L11 methyltransferase [Bauldia sp.]